MFDLTGKWNSSDDATPADSATLRWLLAANALSRAESRLFRNNLEREEMLLMQKPVATRGAMGVFGLTMGGIPSAAIFYRLFDLFHLDPFSFLSLMAVVMFAVCLWAGRSVGRSLATTVDGIERQSWIRMLIMAFFAGISWGAATGAAGGAVFFGIGAPFGAFCAADVGAIGFPIFLSLHRILSRGGLIEAQHLWPISIGVACVLAALILGV
jgi:hypothetical protein